MNLFCDRGWYEFTSNYSFQFKPCSDDEIIIKTCGSIRSVEHTQSNQQCIVCWASPWYIRLRRHNHNWYYWCVSFIFHLKPFVHWWHIWYESRHVRQLLLSFHNDHSLFSQVPFRKFYMMGNSGFLWTMILTPKSIPSIDCYVY